MKIAPLSMREYTDDLVALVDSLDSPPLIVGLSLGGLLAQLVAARTCHAGVVAACPAPAPGFIPKPTMLRNAARLVGRHYLQPRPWAKPLYPPTWERFRRSIANTQSEEIAREFFADLVCESGRAYCELAFGFLDRGKAATVNFAAVTTPVLVIQGDATEPSRHRSPPGQQPGIGEGPTWRFPLRPPRLFWGGTSRHHGPHRRLDRQESRACLCLATLGGSWQGESRMIFHAVEGSSSHQPEDVLTKWCKLQGISEWMHARGLAIANSHGHRRSAQPRDCADTADVR